MTADRHRPSVSTDGRVEVEFEPPPRCQGCDGACLWCRLPGEQRLTFRHTGGAVRRGTGDRHDAGPLSAARRGRRLRRAARRPARGRRSRARVRRSDLGAAAGAARASRWRCSRHRGCADGSSATRCGAWSSAGSAPRCAHSLFTAVRSAISASGSWPTCCRCSRAEPLSRPVDVDSSVALERRYGLRIPVLVAGDLELSGYPLDRERVRATSPPSNEVPGPNRCFANSAAFSRAREGRALRCRYKARLSRRRDTL